MNFLLARPAVSVSMVASISDGYFAERHNELGTKIAGGFTYPLNLRTWKLILRWHHWRPVRGSRGGAGELLDVWFLVSLYLAVWSNLVRAHKNLVAQGEIGVICLQWKDVQSRAECGSPRIGAWVRQVEYIIGGLESWTDSSQHQQASVQNLQDLHHLPRFFEVWWRCICRQASPFSRTQGWKPCWKPCEVSM